MNRAFLLALLLGIASPVCAAEITAGRTIITLRGLIEPGDADIFKVKAEQFPGKATVILNSPGGNLLAGLAIGEFIRLRGWSTYVSDECDSACALMWLGGVPRLMTASARIGFHGASIDGEEMPLGNIALGAYLNKMGLSDEAVRYTTQAGPIDVTYFTPSDAKRLGIEVTVVPDGDASIRLVPEQKAQQAAPESASLQAENEASFLVKYLFSNTSNNAKTLAVAYWDNPVYHGKTTPVVSILADKQRFFDKWPVRSYTIRSMTPARCPDDNGIVVECQVSGIVDWEARSQTQKSVGSATFEYVLSPWPLGSWSYGQGGQVGLRIAAEDGRVFSNQVTSLTRR